MTDQDETPHLPGLDNPEGPFLCAALLRGTPLIALKHKLVKLEGTIWHHVAQRVAGASNGNAAERMVASVENIRATGFSHADTRRAVFEAITTHDGFVEEWLKLDPLYFKRKSINRKRYKGLEGMFKETLWIWPGWIPKGFISVLAGRPGIGKSMMLAWWSTIVLRGGKFPDGFECEGDDKAQIMWIDTEGTQQLLMERFAEMGTPTDNIFYPTGDKPEDQEFPNVDLTKGYWREIITALAIDERPLWIIIDSLRGSHSAKEKDDAAMSSIMSWAAALTRDIGCAFTFTHHLRKSQPGHPEEVSIDDFRGSGVIGAMTRSGIAVDKPDPGDQTLRLHIVKTNLAKFPQPQGVQLAEHGIPAIAGYTPKRQRAATLTERACDFLIARLTNGPRIVDELIEEAEQIGISKRTLKTAKYKLDLVALPRDKENPKWRWALQAKPGDRAVEVSMKPWNEKDPPF